MEKKNVPGKILFTLFFDFDVQQDEGVRPELRILAHAIVEAVWAPRIGEEDERDRLAEVVQLQTARADRVHDGRVVYDARWDAKRPGAEEDVGVRRRAKRVSDDKESNILIMGVSQDLVTFRLNHITIRGDDGLAVKVFLNGRDISSESGKSEISDMPGGSFVLLGCLCRPRGTRAWMTLRPMVEDKRFIRTEPS